MPRDHENGSRLPRLRYSTAEVAEMLCVSADRLYKMVADGILSATTNNGERGLGRRMYFNALEIQAFATGGAPAAKAFRESQGVKTKPCRGRKARVA